MNMNEQYNVVFDGKIQPEQDINIVKSRVLQHLKIPEAQLANFFSGKEIPLKNNLSLDEAMKLRAQLEKLGLVIKIRPVEVAKVAQPIQKVDEIPKALKVDVKSRVEFEGEYDYENYEPLAPIPAIFAFDCESRFGRLSFINAQLALILAIIPLGIIYYILITFLSSTVFSIILLLVMAGVYIVFSYRIVILRLHDVNLSGWFVLIYALGRIPVAGPFIEFLFTLFLVLAPGTKGANNYGAQPEQGSKIGLIGFAIIIPIAIGFVSYVEYETAQTKKAVEESFVMVANLQQNIESYYREKEKFPTIINNVSGWQEVLKVSPVIDRLDLTEQGLLEITYNDEIEQGAFITLAPYVNDGLITWRCYESNLSYEYIPDQCLSEIDNYYTSDYDLEGYE